jgi:ankyrin repeat protein
MGIKYTEQQKELIAAARLGDLDGVKKLIDQGFDTDCELKYGSSALMIAASRGHEPVVRALAEAGAKVNRRNRFGATALLEACEKGHHDVIRTLVQFGAEINLPHNNGTTVLLAATFRRDIKTIKIVLELGGDPDVANFDGWSPRKWAKSEANPALLDVFGLTAEEQEQLSEKGDGQESSQESAQNSQPVMPVVNDAFWTAFMRAASNGDKGMVRRLVEEDNVEINAQSPNGTTALIAAAKNGQTETVFELIELGADLNLADQEGLTALAWAAKKGQVMIVQTLKQKGAKEGEDEQTDSDSERTSESVQPR